MPPWAGERTAFPREVIEAALAYLVGDAVERAYRRGDAGDETIDYAFMGQDPDAADNRWLREAFENRIPVIYFLGTSPSA